MTNSEYDITHASSSIAALASDDGEGVTVSGVAIGVGDQTKGMSEKQTVWPASTLEAAEGMLTGAPITKGQLDGSPHPGARKTDDGVEVDPTPPVDTVVGEVTDDSFVEGVGLVWEGRIIDEALAQKVEAGLVDVSPVVARDIQTRDGGNDVFEATEIHGFRDLTVVTRGAAPSNSIEPGTAAAMSGDEIAALAAETFGNSSATPSDDPAGASSSGTDPTPTQGGTMDPESLTDKQKALLRRAEDIDDPTVVSEEQTDLLSEAEQYDNPEVVDGDEFEALQERVDDVRTVMEDALQKRTDLKESTVEALEFGALCAEFEDDDGNIDAEALVQTPETSDPDEEDLDTDDDAVEALVDELGADGRDDAVELLEAQHRNFANAGWETQANDVKEQLEALGVEVDD